MIVFAELQRRNVIRMAGLYLVGAWLIVQVAGTVLPMFDVSASVLRVVVTALAIGFLPAMVFAWVFELTPEGIKRDGDVPPEQSIAPQTGRRMDRLIMALLAVALVYFGIDKFVLAPRRDAALVASTTAAVKELPPTLDDKSVAVLPFEDLSPGHDQEYFADGMAEELLDALAKVQDLKVAGRTSSFYFKGKNETLTAIGTALGVANVLEGSVRKQGDKVRVTLQLIETKSGFHRWSESYDGDLKDVFELQEHIARAVTDALKVVLQDRTARLVPDATGSSEAHEQYLRGRSLVYQRGYGNLRSAEVAFKAALALDPNYADAWAGLSQTYALLPQYVWSDPTAHDFVDTNPLAIGAAEHALELDPKSSTALSTRAAIRYSINFDWAGAEADFRAAILANPRDTTAHQWYGEFLSTERRWAESDAQFQAALAIDPLSAVVHFAYGESLAEHRQFDAALDRFDRALQLSPGFVEPATFKTAALIDMGRYDEAAEFARILPDSKREEMLLVIAALRDPSRKPEAVKYELEHGGQAILLAPLQLARLGDYEAAMGELERQFAAKAPFREYLYVVPQFEPLHKDPRFQALLRQIGLPRTIQIDKPGTQ